VIATGTPQEVVNHPEVVASYLGADAEVIARSGSRETTANGKRPTKARTGAKARK
jgi:hypothetical protein